jgi:hypothetical protein
MNTLISIKSWFFRSRWVLHHFDLVSLDLWARVCWLSRWSSLFRFACSPQSSIWFSDLVLIFAAGSERSRSSFCTQSISVFALWAEHSVRSLELCFALTIFPVPASWFPSACIGRGPGSIPRAGSSERGPGWVFARSCSDSFCFRSSASLDFSACEFSCGQQFPLA